MTLTPIRNDDDHAAALIRLGTLWDAKPGTAEADELEILALVINAYEDKHHALPKADPIELLTYYMEQHDLKARDLLDVFGTTGRVSEVLNRKRPLTLQQIRKLARRDLDVQILIQEYDLAG